MLRAGGAPDKEICRRLGIHRNTIYRRLQHATRALQELLDVA